MAAVRIQAAYRGHLARKPVSTALDDPAAAHVFWTMERVRLKRIRAGRPAALRNMNAEQLLAEKQDVKVLLVDLDKKFEAKHGRMPSKREKERLRPIYRLYNDLKRFLAAASGTGAHGNQQLAKNGDAQDGSAPDRPSRAAAADGAIGGPSSRPRTREALGGSGTRSSSTPSRQHRRAARVAAPDRIGELEKLQREKRRLQVQLNKFEQTFQKANGRPIKWESDISAVKADYERYKVLKASIAAMQGSSQSQQPP